MQFCRLQLFRGTCTLGATTRYYLWVDERKCFWCGGNYVDYCATRLGGTHWVHILYSACFRFNKHSTCTRDKAGEIIDTYVHKQHKHTSKYKTQEVSGVQLLAGGCSSLLTSGLLTSSLNPPEIKKNKRELQTKKFLRHMFGRKIQIRLQDLLKFFSS